MAPGLLLHLAVPTGQAAAVIGRALGARAVADGRVAAIVGPVRVEGTTRAALRHARIVAHALGECTSLVPFRAGIEVGSEEEARALLAENREELTTRLRELAGLVEMGLKVRIRDGHPGPGADLDSALAAIRALPSRDAHREERRRPVPGGSVLEGCYLVSRTRIDPFWSEVAALRAATGLPVLGTGPWAPYTFCDLSLRTPRRAPSGAPPLERSLS